MPVQQEALENGPPWNCSSSHSVNIQLQKWLTSLSKNVHYARRLRRGCELRKYIIFYYSSPALMLLYSMHVACVDRLEGNAEQQQNTPKNIEHSILLLESLLYGLPVFFVTQNYVMLFLTH